MSWYSVESKCFQALKHSTVITNSTFSLFLSELHTMSSLIVFVLSSVIGINAKHHGLCPILQSPDSHSVCRIFHNTNIKNIIHQNFSISNYCEWGYEYTLIGCYGDDDDKINIIELQYQQGLNGTLNFNYSWPESLIELDLEQSASSSTNLYGEWNWQSMKLLNNLVELDLEGNEV